MPATFLDFRTTAPNQFSTTLKSSNGNCRSTCWSSSILYRVPEILTLGRFPDAHESDSTWRTQEVRHVGSDTIAPRLWCVPAAWFGEEDERRPSGPSASGARRNL